MPVHVSLPSQDNFRVSEALLRSHVTPRSKVLMVNSPSNPTGRVLRVRRSMPSYGWPPSST